MIYYLFHDYAQFAFTLAIIGAVVAVITLISYLIYEARSLVAQGGNTMQALDLTAR